MGGYMSNIQSNRSQQYKYIAAFILIFFITVITASQFSDGKEHGYVDNPNISFNFEVLKNENEYIYSGEVINNEDFELKELSIILVDKSNKNQIVDYVFFNRNYKFRI